MKYIKNKIKFTIMALWESDPDKDIKIINWTSFFFHLLLRHSQKIKKM